MKTSETHRTSPWMIAGLLFLFALGALAGEPETLVPGSDWPWWYWSLLLFTVSFGLGIVAVLAGIGGAVLFVPIVSGFFPFHLDFVRGTGLLLALSGALSASPELLRSGMVNLRFTLPLALIASCSAVVGAFIGLALPAATVQIALGVVILFVATLMLLAKRAAYPDCIPDAWAKRLNFNGVYYDQSLDRDVSWSTHRTPPGLILFVGIGFVAGMFGLGSGWANVPVLNLVMGVPLKVAVACSVFLLSIVGTTAAWVYINQGAVLPLIAVPAVLGIMLGARIGVLLLKRTPAATIRKILIVTLFFAGFRALWKGLGG